MRHLPEGKVRVNKMLLAILSLLLSFASPSIHAELLLSSANIDTQTFYRIKTTLRAFSLNHSRDFRDGHSDPHYFTNDEGFGSSNFIWKFKGKEYISSVMAFVPDATAVEGISGGAANPHFRYQCHFFLLDAATLNVVAVTPLVIKVVKDQLSDQPYCIYAQALSLAKEIDNGILVVLGYGDSADPPNLRSGEFDFSTTTLLMRLSDDDGTLKIEQDDSCLRNPNKYSTIASARKALKRCVARK